MSNNNATAAAVAEGRAYNGEQHIKRTTNAATAAAATSTSIAVNATTTTTKLQVDEKLRAAITGNVVLGNGGGGGGCGEEGAVAAAATSMMSACDRVALGVGGMGMGGVGVGVAMQGEDYDVNCEGAAAVVAGACATNFGVGDSVNDVDDVATDDVAAGAASWLAMQMYAATNNNIATTTTNNTVTVTDSIAKLAELQQMALTNWWVDENGIVHKYDEEDEDDQAAAACQIADKGGGGVASSIEDRRYMTEEEERQFVELNGEYGPRHHHNLPIVDLDLEYALAAAHIITPPEHNTHSNRTSLNNSTENLSYNSDYNYQDDIILLDDELDPEEVSLNSDDCIYAYRGDGDEMEFAVLNAKNVKATDDETDFLEMDFEPDPLSEVEYGEGSAAAGLADNAAAGAACSDPSEPLKSHANALLLQRNSCHISSSTSGRQSSLVNNKETSSQTLKSSQPPLSLQAHPHQQRQHFSSPIEELQSKTANCLQTQAMLTKNFARISLHLDQINLGESKVDTLHLDKSKKDLSSIEAVDFNVSTHSTAAARSLPSTLNAYAIEREAQNLADELQKAPAKVTGAKPKRLSRFSSTSSTSSKTSTKSRNSLRASLTPAICSSVSFDERSVSCNDFRSTTQAPLNQEETSASSAIVHVSNPLQEISNFQDETCLDCLENEFLASTIGKIVDTNKCLKCHKRRQSSSYYHQTQTRLMGSSSTTNEQRCRSGSPTYMLEYNYQREEAIFDEFAASTCSQWLVPQKRHSHSNNNNIGIRAANELYGDKVINAGQQQQQISSLHKKKEKLNFCIERSQINQRRKQQRDSYKAEQQEALKNFVMTEPEVKICTLDITEDVLVQALDKLHVPYNSELIKVHFATATNSGKVFKNLKEFLVHASKKNCNHSKIKRLIELATRQQVEVTFKEDPSQTPPAMISVKVTDIIQQWTRNKDLVILKQLDKRFLDANIMGKVANVIRQAQQQQQSRGTARRPLLEFIQIPQYYPSGHLILKNKKKF